MRAVRRAAVLALTVALGGCVLFIDPIEATEHCSIEGTSECATCMRNGCQAQIDACCGSSECTASSLLSELDDCGGGDRAACSDALGRSRIGEAEELARACVVTSCGPLCGPPGAGTSGGAKWTCGTPRETTRECAACVYQSCGSGLDACCADASCKNDSSIQTDVGACVSGDARGCAYLRDESRSTSGQAGVVRRCIEEQCGPKCLGDGLPHTRCTLHDGGRRCSCSNSETAGTQECTAAVVSGDACVIGTDGCSCGSYSCDESSSGCSCSFGEGGVSQYCNASPSSSSSGSTSGVCCLKLQAASISCECRDYGSECYADLGQYSVPSCDLDVLLESLEGTGRVVSACSR